MVAFIATVARSLSRPKFGRADVQAMKILVSAAQFRPLPNIVVTACGHNNDLTGRNRVDPLVSLHSQEVLGQQPKATSLVRSGTRLVHGRSGQHARAPGTQSRGWTILPAFELL